MTARRRWLGLGLAFLALQLLPFGRVARVATRGELPAPPQVRAMFERACYDCHSNRTRWPWYARVAPVSWWLAAEVRKGRAGVDYTAWDDYTERQRQLHLETGLARVHSKLMPPAAYLSLHSEARLSAADIALMGEFVARVAAPPLAPAELLAWPARPLVGSGPLRGVWRTRTASLEDLQLHGGLLLVDGDLELRGLRGQGAILVTGKLSVTGLEGRIGPLALVSLGEMGLQGTRGASLAGPVRSPALTVEQLQLTDPDDLDLEFETVRELKLEFCRDDGELGEILERKIVARWGYGQYCLWDPEFQKVEYASSLDEALEASARLLAAGPSTRLKLWKRRFRQAWRNELQSLPQGTPARLTVEPSAPATVPP